MQLMLGEKQVLEELFWFKFITEEAPHKVSLSTNDHV
jgi:hypothetical protein